MSGRAFAADYQVVDLGANISPNDTNSSRAIAGARNTDVYKAAGNYIAVLTVRDDGGLTAMSSVDMSLRKSKR